MDWLFLTFISIGFRSVYGVMTKVLSNKINVSAYTHAVILPLAAAAIALIISPFIGGLSFDFSHVSMITVLLVIFGQGLGNITYFAAIKNLTNGTAQIAFSSILFFNTFLALIFLNLNLSLLNVFGLMLLVLAILSVVSGKIELNKKGVSMMVLSAFLFSVFQLSSADISHQVGAATYLLIAYLGAAGVVFILKAKLVTRELSSSKKLSTITVPLLTAIPSIGNFLFAYYAYQIAPQPAKVAMLLTAQIVLTVILSYFFLKEKGHLRRKLAAAVLVVISAILIKG